MNCSAAIAVRQAPASGGSARPQAAALPGFSALVKELAAELPASPGTPIPGAADKLPKSGTPQTSDSPIPEPANGTQLRDTPDIPRRFTRDGISGNGKPLRWPLDRRTDDVIVPVLLPVLQTPLLIGRKPSEQAPENHSDRVAAPTDLKPDATNEQMHPDVALHIRLQTHDLPVTAGQTRASEEQPLQKPKPGKTSPIPQADAPSSESDKTADGLKRRIVIASVRPTEVEGQPERELSPPPPAPDAASHNNSAAADPDLNRAGPAVTPRTQAAEQPATPNAHLAEPLHDRKQAAQPLRSMSLEFAPEGARDIKLRLSERAGEVHISLHSNDSALSGTVA